MIKICKITQAIQLQRAGTKLLPGVKGRFTLKAITESALREELRSTQPDTYVVLKGKLLTPAAREYLQQRKIKIVTESAESVPTVPDLPPSSEVKGATEAHQLFTDYCTGGYYTEKPEHMTHLHGSVLVPKSHPRIAFRGKLDSLQSMVVLSQAIIYEDAKRADRGEISAVCGELSCGQSGSARLINDLDDILSVLRNIMCADVLEREYVSGRIIGLSHEELREHSHHPDKYYGVEPMTLPTYTMGKHYALLNQLRTAVRECEVYAVNAFCGSEVPKSVVVVQELNRLSSAIHIMMCRYQSGEYR